MLLRYQVFLSYGTVLLAFWWWGLSSSKQQLSESAEIASIPTKLTEHRLVLVFAPLLGVIGLGLYLLTRLVVGVASFRDCNEAAVELDAQIKEAKTQLRKRRIIVD